MKAQYQAQICAGKRMVAVLAIASCPGMAEGGITFNDFPAEPTVEAFPDDSPPTDPPIESGEDADCRSGASLSEPEYNYGGSAGAWTVINVDITVSGISTIRIPQSNNNADDDLYKHEFGHHRLAKFEYTKRARGKVEKAIATLAGKTFATKAAADQAVDAATDTASTLIDAQIGVLFDKYDTLTDHGRKRTPSADAAVGSLVSAKERAPAGGTARAAVDTGRTWAGSGDPPTVDFIGGDLHFAGNQVIDQTSDPLDPLRNGGQFSIGSMAPIGLDDNGTILLSDAGFDINAIGGGSLVTGALFEASYGVSEVPGFAGMIQASLWIAPQMWGGVDNAMGSTMLGEMASASNAGTLMTFWFLSDQALFSATGEPLAVGAVTGKVRIGYTVPTPGAIMMLALGLTACVWGLRRR